MSMNDGGQAFPAARMVWDHDLEKYIQSGFCEGMSLRDWFAGHETLGELDHPEAMICAHICEALAGEPKPHGAIDYLKWDAKWRAAWRYIRADAMIAARESTAMRESK